MYLTNVYCKLKTKKHVLHACWSKKIHALIFKVLKSIYIFESTNTFIYEHIALIFDFKQVQSRVYSETSV